MFVLPGKLTFLHLPKTGGNWISDVFRRAGVEVVALDYHERSSNVPAEHIGLPRVGFIREPVGWHRSWFQFHKRMSPVTHWITAYGSDVAGFVGNMITLGDAPPSFPVDEGGFATVHRDLVSTPPTAGQGFLDWLSLRTFDGGSDEILKFENLREEMVRLVGEHSLGNTAQQTKELIEDFMCYPPVNMSGPDPELEEAMTGLASGLLASEAAYVTRHGY